VEGNGHGPISGTILTPAWNSSWPKQISVVTLITKRTTSKPLCLQI